MEVEISQIFGRELQTEAEIVLDIIERHLWSIVHTGGNPNSFAVYCKEHIQHHYEKHPDERFVNIYFQKHNLGFDRWMIDRILKYEKRTK